VGLARLIFQEPFVFEYTLLIYYVFYLSAAFFWPSYRVWRQTGHNPFVLDSGGDIHSFVGNVFKLTLVVTAVTLIINAVSSTFYQYLAPFTWLAQPALVIMGMLGLIVSLLWILLAQYHMGLAWRVGIDHGTKTGLVEKGVFGRSRNPIFLGVVVGLGGLFFVLPNALTLLTAVVLMITVQMQVLLEETYLLEKHGDAYRVYCTRVPRWL
jgi:protein-S-isoprenylcysteine O-methyltransferase Ste14